MNIWILLAIVGMIFLVIFQIAKASEYVSVLKGEKKSREQSNKINAFLMLAFLIVGLIGAYLCNKALAPKTLFPQGSASLEGIQIDNMFMVTLVITGIVFLITQVGLFWFSFKYQEKEGKKPYFFAHSTKLEAIWTVIPAIALGVLVVIGLRHWLKITGEAPKNSLIVEITGKQFGWMMRYPGKDGVFGKKHYRNIDEKISNNLGLLFKDNDTLGLKADPAAFDDVFVSQTMKIVVGVPVKLVINSRDVIHDVGLPHFRMKMDAVPGTPTTLWFTPRWTTKEMRERLANPNFEYEIVCDQLCGANHYAMKGIIEVVSQEEYDKWIIGQKSNYYTAYPDEEQKKVANIVDTVKTVVSKNGKN